MKHNFKYLFLVGLIALGGCTTQNNDSSNTTINSGENSTSDTISETTSETVSNPITSDHSSEEVPPSSELVPLADPDVARLERSPEWPSSALATYLLYGQNIEMPIFTSEVDFHHGLYNDELFYRVMTRVRSVADFNAYKSALENDYDFNVVFEDGLYYAESMYDDVRLYLEYKVVAGRHEVSFDFFDGNGDKYSGPEAVDNLATFNLRTKEALTSISASRGKWEVRPATFTVYKKTSGYNVGNTNNEHIANPLRFYPGQQATFKVSDKYYIEKIIILAASGYAEETVLNGTLSNGVATHNVDFVTLTPSGQVSEIDYTLAQVIDVGQVRWLEIRLTFAKKV